MRQGFVYRSELQYNAIEAYSIFSFHHGWVLPHTSSLEIYTDGALAAADAVGASWNALALRGRAWIPLSYRIQREAFRWSCFSFPTHLVNHLYNTLRPTKFKVAEMILMHAASAVGGFNIRLMRLQGGAALPGTRFPLATLLMMGFNRRLAAGDTPYMDRRCRHTRDLSFIYSGAADWR